MKRSNAIVNWRTSVVVLAVMALIVAVVWIGFRWKPSVTRNTTSRPTCGVHCGTERWAVKTLSDDDASCVNFTPKQTTVSWLVSQQAPERLSEERRSAAIECQVWEITGQLVEFKAEDDGDFHAVLADLQHPDLTMIVEIPDPACSGACSSPHEPDIARTRASFEQAFGSPSKRFQRTSKAVIVTVTGVGFFDFKHRQTGLAQNGVELHPVIRFEIDNATRP